MIRLKIFMTGLLALCLFTSISMAQEQSRHEISVQGTGFLTRDSNENGIRQHTTDSGGLLTGYRFHFNRWLAAEGMYGYSRNTWQNFTTPNALNVQANTHQSTGAFVVTSPRTFAGLRPYALTGVGALTFDPTNKPGGTIAGANRQTKASFLYGAGTDVNLTQRVALRFEYRGLVYNRPDFGLTALRSANATTHTGQPSAGFVIRF